MQIVVALVVIWLLFVVLSWLLHAAKWLLVVAIIASLVVVAAKYLRQIIRYRQNCHGPLGLKTRRPRHRIFSQGSHVGTARRSEVTKSVVGGPST